MTTVLRASSVGEWREIAEWDWVSLNDDEPTSPATIHAIELLDNAATADDDWFGVGVTACGKAGEMYIPGLFIRMAARRCPACCDAVGMPHGEQSPKNIDECRPIVEARLRALKGASEEAAA